MAVDPELLRKRAEWVERFANYTGALPEEYFIRLNEIDREIGRQRDAEAKRVAERRREERRKRYEQWQAEAVPKDQKPSLVSLGKEAIERALEHRNSRTAQRHVGQKIDTEQKRKQREEEHKRDQKALEEYMQRKAEKKAESTD